MQHIVTLAAWVGLKIYRFWRGEDDKDVQHPQTRYTESLKVLFANCARFEQRNDSTTEEEGRISHDLRSSR